MMKKASFGLVFLFLFLFVCVVLFFSTESGLVIIQKSINRFSGGMVSIGEVSGRLADELSLKDIRLPGVDVDISVQQVELSWHPERLFKAELGIAKVVLTGMDIVVKDGRQSHSGSAVVQRPAIQLPAVLLPFPVVIEDFAVNKIAIFASDGEQLFQIDRFTASLAANAERLHISEFDVQGPDIWLALHGNIEVRENWALNLLGNWHLAGFGFYPMVGTFSVTGPLNNPHVEIGIHSPGSIRVKGDLVNLLQRPEWTAQLEAKDVDLSTLIEYCPKIELAKVTGNLSGDFANYRGHVQADGEWDALKKMHLDSHINGNEWGIDFPSLRIYGKESSAEAIGGTISWRDIFSWEGRFLFKNFDPSIITEELQGRLNSELVSKGDVQENGVVASFAISRLDGILRDHKVSAAGNVFLGETDVHTDGLTLRSGEVAGLVHIENGLFSWADKPSWSAKVRMDSFDPSFLYTEFPGSISSEFEGEGKRSEKGLEGSLHIKKISGTLRGNQLTGGGKIAILGETLQTPGLVLGVGPSRLEVNGQAGDSLAFHFSLSSPDIGTVLPDSKGSILFKGSLQGNRNEPQLDAELQGNGLRYGNNSLGQIRAKIHSILKNNGQLTGSFIGERLSLPGFVLDKGAIAVNGTLADHQIKVDGAGPMGIFGGKAHGSYQNKWQGQLSGFQLDALEYGIWRQQDKATVAVGREGVALKNFCLTGEEGLFCLGGDVRLEKEFLWKVHGRLSSLPLHSFDRLQLIPVPVIGLLHADITANGNSHRLLSAKMAGGVSAVDVLPTVKDTELPPFYLAGSELSVELHDALLQAKGTIRMRNGSQILLNADVAGFGDFSSPLGSLTVHGNLAFQEFDLSALSVFTGYGVEPSGWINNSFTLAGTVDQPKIYGKVSVRNGGIDLPYQGITLENIDLSIEADGEAAHVTGTATSGPGKLAAAGTLQYNPQGIEGIFNITGNDFLLVNLPEYTVRVNPDVSVIVSNDKGDIKGVIDVPYGVITPEEMSNSISASGDVVFVHDTEEELVKGWPIDLDIKVRLGKEVRVDGYGLTGRLEGELMVNTTPDNSLAGRGELDLIEGAFTIYGRSLSIERGRMLFSGGPIDNPGIDVRAQVKVDDEKARGAGYTVGVDISGLVQDLEYHLFSDPFMEDTEILSLMIVGHSLAGSTESEGNILEAAAVTLGVQGSLGFVRKMGNLLFLDDLHLEGSSTKQNVSLVVGKRLTKDLYIGYDLNMFNQLGQFRVRYDLTNGFSVETSSSSESTGADLLYSFER